MLTTILVSWDNNNQPYNQQKLEKIIDWWQQKSNHKPTITSINNNLRQSPRTTLYPISEIEIISNKLTYKEGETKINMDLTSIQLDKNNSLLTLDDKNTRVEFQY